MSTPLSFLQSAMSDTNVLREEHVAVTLLNTTVDVVICIHTSWTTLVDFSLFGVPYLFSITKWGSQKFAKFMERFYDHSERDPAIFGTSSRDAEGLFSFSANVDQRSNAVMQAVKDVLTCLDKICVKYQRCVLDYALWYREKYRPATCDYSHFITLVTCHCITHVDFMTPNINWDVVQF